MYTSSTCIGMSGETSHSNAVHPVSSAGQLRHMQKQTISLLVDGNS